MCYFSIQNASRGLFRLIQQISLVILFRKFFIHSSSSRGNKHLKTKTDSLGSLLVKLRENTCKHHTLVEVIPSHMVLRYNIFIILRDATSTEREQKPMKKQRKILLNGRILLCKRRNYCLRFELVQ